MLNLFSEGGPLAMGILSLILLSLVAIFIMTLIKKGEEKQINQSLQWLKSLGTLGLVVGIFFQLIGLYTAFSIIENAQGISPSILAGGLKISLITTLYGLLIYVIHLVCTMILRRMH